MSDEGEEKKCDCVAGLPPWMGTFADLMSLLMCFFVLLLSFAEMNAMKFQRLAGSMAQAFGVQNKLNVTDIPKGTSIIAQEFSPGIPDSTPINEIWQHTENITEMSLEVDCAAEYDIEQGSTAEEAGIAAKMKAKIRKQLEQLVEETRQDAAELAQALEQQIIAGEIEIEARGRQIVIRIREKGSFKSGSAEMADDYYNVMDEIRNVLKKKPGKIEVQGHSDNIPIKTARFRSNWELSSARAVSVAHALMKGEDINQKRFSVSGYADTEPLVPNDTAINKAKNRRVEIVIRQGLDSSLDDDEKALLKEGGQDILRDLDLDPEYLFNLKPEEIF